MLIGTDASIAECVNTGYLMVSFPKKLEDKPIKPDYTFDFVEVVGGWEYGGYSETNSENWNIGSLKLIYPNTRVYRWSLEDLIERYESRKSGIDCFIGGKHSTNPEDYETIYDVLNLASDINGYMGLDE